MINGWFMACSRSLLDWHSFPRYLRLRQTRSGREYPKFVKVVEVGPRDGLQNEKVSPLFSHECNLCASWRWDTRYLRSSDVWPVCHNRPGTHVSNQSSRDDSFGLFYFICHCFYHLPAAHLRLRWLHWPQKNAHANVKGKTWLTAGTKSAGFYLPSKPVQAVSVSLFVRKSFRRGWKSSW